MMMKDDADLLRQYAKDRSEEAFAELVRRHLDLVYGAALRLVGGDTHRAQDVAQSVFTDLARKAAALAGHPSLIGWLYTSTRFAASKAVRTEQRRQTHEHEAQVMYEASHPSPFDTEWDRIRPVLDDAMGGLSAPDREALLLRFFEGCTFADIGASLRLTEDAARMRVDRALDRMRALLGRRGITSTTTALTAMLAGQAISAAPAGLAAEVVGAAISGAAVGGSVSVLTTAILSKLTIAVTTAVVVAGVTVAIVQHRNMAEVGDLRAARDQLQTEKAQWEARLQASAAEKNSNIDQPQADESIIPLKDLKNVGRATPRSAYETVLWAAAMGNTNALVGMLKLTDAGRAKAEALLAGLPSDLRTQYSSPEQFVALMMTSDTHHLVGIQLLGRTTQGPDDVTLYPLVQFKRLDGSDGKSVDTIPLHRRDDGWQAVIGSAEVERYVNRLVRKENS